MVSELTIVLEKAWNESIDFDKSTLPKERFASLIEFLLITSTHKTYKYILINGLLGATAGNNPLCLQKGSGLANAWDARSVCHKILVPFERAYLNNRLGGSNEPFLNKPARFMELSHNNAVRGGKDQQALRALIEIFSDININELSTNLLTFALQTVRQIQVSEIITIQSTNLLDDLIAELLSEPCNGESLLFVSGLLLTLIYENFDIRCSPSNQSGASSNEVGDIDIFSNEVLISAIEIKDKLFSNDDYQHALSKCLSQDVTSFLFISRQNYINTYLQNQNLLNIPNNLVSIESLKAIASPLVNDRLSTIINDYSKSFLKSARPKETTVDHINSILTNFQ